jgi:hypothetical protein
VEILDQLKKWQLLKECSMKLASILFLKSGQELSSVESFVLQFAIQKLKD